MSETLTSQNGVERRDGTLQHIAYVLRSNPVTLLAFSMFAVLICAAVLGHALVPYDPLASNALNGL